MRKHMDLNKCFVCRQSLEEDTGYNIVLCDIQEGGERLSDELEGYLCEDCKDRVLQFIAGRKATFDFIKEQKEAEND